MDTNVPFPPFFKPKPPSLLDTAERFFRSNGETTRRGCDDLVAKSVVSTASGSQTILYRLTEYPKGQLNVEAELQEIAPEGERSMLCAACEALWISPYGRIHRIGSYEFADGATIEDINQIYMDIYHDFKPVMDAVDAARGYDDSDLEDGTRE